MHTLIAIVAILAAQNKPVNINTGPSREPRQVGVDYPRGAFVQALGAATEALIVATAGAEANRPVCIPYGTGIVVSSDQRTCVCFAGAVPPAIDIAAPTGDGGCAITDNNGPDRGGVCGVVEPNIPHWFGPDVDAVSQGWPGIGNRSGLCDTRTTTVAGLGAALRHPCRANSECTGTIGSGNCTVSGITPAIRETVGCLFVLTRPAAAATSYWYLTR